MALPLLSDRQTIEDALRKSRIFIRGFYAWHETQTITLEEFLKDWTEGGEVEAIDAALLELGIIT